jgi:hypothetical protein
MYSLQSTSEYQPSSATKTCSCKVGAQGSRRFDTEAGKCGAANAEEIERINTKIGVESIALTKDRSTEDKFSMNSFH